LGVFHDRQDLDAVVRRNRKLVPSCFLRGNLVNLIDISQRVVESVRLGLWLFGRCDNVDVSGVLANHQKLRLSFVV